MADSLIAALCAALMFVLVIGSTSTPADRARVEAEQRRELTALAHRTKPQAEHDMPAKADPVKKCLNDCHVEHCDCHVRCAEVEDPLGCAWRCNDDEKQCQRKCEVFQSLRPR